MVEAFAFWLIPFLSTPGFRNFCSICFRSWCKRFCPGGVFTAFINDYKAFAVKPRRCVNMQLNLMTLPAGTEATLVSFEYPAKKPREESQISVTTISKIVSLKRHTNDTHKDTANKPRKELHISVMIRSEITSVNMVLFPT